MILFNESKQFVFTYNADEYGMNFVENATGVQFAARDVEVLVSAEMQALVYRAVASAMQHMNRLNWSNGDTLTVTIRATAEGVSVGISG